MDHIHLLMDPVLLPPFGYHEQCCCEHGVQTLAHAQLSVPMVIYLGVESSHPLNHPTDCFLQGAGQCMKH